VIFITWNKHIFDGNWYFFCHKCGYVIIPSFSYYRNSILIIIEALWYNCNIKSFATTASRPKYIPNILCKSNKFKNLIKLLNWNFKTHTHTHTHTHTIFAKGCQNSTKVTLEKACQEFLSLVFCDTCNNINNNDNNSSNKNNSQKLQFNFSSRFPRDVIESARINSSNSIAPSWKGKKISIFFFKRR